MFLKSVTYSSHQNDQMFDLPIKPVVCVSWIRKRIVAAKIVAGICVIIGRQIKMKVINTCNRIKPIKA